MDLSTKYLGLELKNPLVAAASPLTKKASSVRELEDAGIGAVVMHSLFQEQIEHEDAERQHYAEHGTESFAEATSYFPAQTDFYRGPEQYLEHLTAIKDAVDIPVIASLNGTSRGGWIEYAQKLAQAGADALELNLYQVAADPTVDGAAIEDRYLEVLREVKKAVKLPVAVKLVPYFSSLAHFAKRLDDAGADGLVLFNRFYQSDIDLESLEVVPVLTLSSPHEMRLPLRWIAILDPIVDASLAATTGVYTSIDVLKLLMAGADVTQLCAALLRNGPSAVGHILDGMKEWMAEHQYESVQQMQGSMNQRSCPDPTAFERGQYMKTLNSYSLNI
ncbi:MAG: dihydroorotate dehydrogenase-like protein [Planctomycetota bacterium]